MTSFTYDFVVELRYSKSIGNAFREIVVRQVGVTLTVTTNFLEEHGFEALRRRAEVDGVRAYEAKKNVGNYTRRDERVIAFAIRPA